MFLKITPLSHSLHRADIGRAGIKANTHDLYYHHYYRVRLM